MNAGHFGHALPTGGCIGQFVAAWKHEGKPTVVNQFLLTSSSRWSFQVWKDCPLPTHLCLHIDDQIMEAENVKVDNMLSMLMIACWNHIYFNNYLRTTSYAPPDHATHHIIHTRHTPHHNTIFSQLSRTLLIHHLPSHLLHDIITPPIIHTLRHIHNTFAGLASFMDFLEASRFLKFLAVSWCQLS